MGKWHDDMMLSSRSFRECHEDKITEKIIVDDYISITNQGYNNYFSSPEYANGFEVSKKYKVIINDNEFIGVAYGLEENMIGLNITGHSIRYNTLSERYVINYYPEEDIGSNPTVNFKVIEITSNNSEKSTIVYDKVTCGLYLNGKHIADGDEFDSFVDFTELREKFNKLIEVIFDADIFMYDRSTCIKINGNIETTGSELISIKCNDEFHININRSYS